MWEGHSSAPTLKPASQAELRCLEYRLGCALPQALHDYHQHLGALDFGEGLLPIEGETMQRIEPLINAFPGIFDLYGSLTATDQVLIPRLISFGDYLGNGNLWCFHQETGAVWYMDHDMAPLLTPMFDDIADYLDALTIIVMTNARRDAGLTDDEGEAEGVLGQRLPIQLIRKWMY